MANEFIVKPTKLKNINLSQGYVSLRRAWPELSDEVPVII